jgi:Tol biopolymer transport system component
MRRFVVVSLFGMLAALLAWAPAAVAASPDDATIAFVDVDYNTGSGHFQFSPYLWAPGGVEPIAIDPAGESDLTDPSWSPDGSMLAFAAAKRGCMSCTSAIWVMDADGSERRMVTDGNHNDAMPAWAPDGTRIAFVRDAYSPASRLYVVGSSGVDPAPLPVGPGAYFDPTWSPDGAHLAYAAATGSALEVWVLEVATGDRARLTTQQGSGPVWSPDGTTIAFNSENELNDNIFVVDADGSDLRQLTHLTSGDAFTPDWSPDGSQLVYSSGSDELALWTMDADGSNQVAILDTPGDHAYPAWRPFQPLGRRARPGGSFFDDNGSIHEPSIEAIAAAGITRGCNPPVNDAYCPDQPVTRGQMAAFLVRALDLPTAGTGDPFTDDDGSVFETDIGAIAAAGITRGCNPPVNDAYCPDQPVTRGQMAAFLVRALDLPSSGSSDLFVDDDGSVFEADIDRLGAAGITRGCNPPANDRYCPVEPVTRAQMASFLTRALELTPIVPPAALTLGPGTLGDLALGDPADIVIATLIDTLGPPVYDDIQQPPSEPLPEGFAADGYFRLARWNRPGLTAIVSDAAYYRSDGRPHLIGIFVTDPNGGAVISTRQRIRVGSSLADLQQAYGAALEVVYDELFDWWLFRINGNEPDNRQLFGMLSGDPALGDPVVILLRTGAESSL